MTRINATIISALQDEVTVSADDTDKLILLLHFTSITKDLKNVYWESVHETYDMLTMINNVPSDILAWLHCCCVMLLRDALTLYNTTLNNFIWGT